MSPKAKKRRRNRSRYRVVAVARRGRPGVTLQRAETIGYSKSHPRLYDLDSSSPVGSIDDMWARAESGLPQLLPALTAAPANVPPLPLRLHLNILLPLVAQLLVRHPEFEERYRERVAASTDRPDAAMRLTSGDVNTARHFDYLSICGLLLECEWWLWSSPERLLVCSDLGYANVVVRDGDVTLTGYAFPISPRMAVYVCRGRSEPVSIEGGVESRRRALTAVESDQLNLTTAGWAPTTVFGRDEASVESAVTVWRDMDGPSDYSKAVPSMVMGEHRAFSLDLIETFLRTLHDAQALEETGQCPSFRDCPACASLMEFARGQFRAPDRH
jgi:hypothetical protein